MSGQGAESNDLVETLANELTERVAYLAEWCDEQRGDATIVTRAIAYLETHHDGPWRGTDWFVHSLAMLIEIAVPNSGLDEGAAEFLSDMQEGIATSYESAPVRKSALRITDEIAKDVKTLQDAGCEYGLVSDILDMNEAMFHGETLSEVQRELLLVAATAAPFVRQERVIRNIDSGG
jgi:hypothetical protein